MAFIEHIKSNKKKYSLLSAALVASIGVSWFSLRHNAYALSVNGEVIAVVKEKETIASVYTNVVETIKTEEGTDIAVNEVLAVEPVHSSSKKLSTEDQVKQAINDVVSYNVAAYEIMVDGEGFAVVDSRETALAILQDIAKEYLPEDSTLVLEAEVNEGVAINEEEALNTQNVVKPQDVDLAQSDNIQNSESIIDNKLVQESAESTAPMLDEEGREIVSIQSALPEAEVNEAVSVGEIDATTIIEKNEENTQGQNIAREIKDLNFNEKVTIRNVYVPKQEVLTAQEAEEVLLGNTREIIQYTLQEGDNIWDIAMKYGTTMEHILEINPQIEDETKMQIGEVIKLEVPDPILSIMTVTETTFKELIPAEIQYVWFSHLYEGDTRIYREGNDGLKEVTVDVTKINGKEVSRTVTEEKVLKEAKIKVIAYGTKEKPVEEKPSSNKGASSSVSTSSSGKFMHPLNGGGRLSSTYGSRWGTFHYGIDFAASAGTPIYAAASGEVIYSGFNRGGYGKLIIIDHGNGYQTYYAHCSSLYVNVGDYVSKGQNIAGVGSTGDSTGNHLHWEIRIDGTPVNPYGYIF